MSNVERNNLIDRIEVARPIAIVAAIGAFSVLSLAIAFVMYRDGSIFAVTWRQHFSEAELAATIIFGFVGAASASTLVPKDASYLSSTIVVFLAAFCTANGGGTIRDILSNQLPFWVSSPEYILIPGISTLLMVSMKVTSTKTAKHVFDLTDDFATGIFCCLGTFKAAALVGTDSPAFFLLAIIIGTMTAVGGGFLRDVAILRRRPRALTTSVGTCAVFGAFVHASFLSAATITDAKFALVPEWFITGVIVMLSIEFTRHIRFFDPAVPDEERPILL